MHFGVTQISLYVPSLQRSNLAPADNDANKVEHRQQRLDSEIELNAFKRETNDE